MELYMDASEYEEATCTLEHTEQIQLADLHC